MQPSFPWLVSLLSIPTWYSHSEALSGTASGESTTREQLAAMTASCRAMEQMDDKETTSSNVKILDAFEYEILGASKSKRTTLRRCVHQMPECDKL